MKLYLHVQLRYATATTMTGEYVQLEMYQLNTVYLHCNSGSSCTGHCGAAALPPSAPAGAAAAPAPFPPPPPPPPPPPLSSTLASPPSSFPFSSLPLLLDLNLPPPPPPPPPTTTTTTCLHNFCLLHLLASIVFVTTRVHVSKCTHMASSKAIKQSTC